MQLLHSIWHTLLHIFEQNLKREISKARMRMVEPLIKGAAGLEYLRKAFANRHGSASHAPTALPITRQWLSSVMMVAEEEWHEYVESLPAVTSNELSSGLPPTTLQTGGSTLVGTKISSQTSSTVDIIGGRSTCFFFSFHFFFPKLSCGKKERERYIYICMVCGFLKFGFVKFVFTRGKTTRMQGWKDWFIG